MLQNTVTILQVTHKEMTFIRAKIRLILRERGDQAEGSKALRVQRLLVLERVAINDVEGHILATHK